ncbi:hypothetical protein ISN44_As12g005430 [Arabidopsis suecica]|uniref:Uncharacterized protein n=1 Tax=Arabidopsis suecica TaxID=45249 RepID=A0A8T1YG14_ARASU|nr:hypothetical protein ISN44_As12g005430 [Arabidopsis suecica]
MSQSSVDFPPKGGFSFDLCKRNDMLTQKGLKAPSFLKTGTTIVGLIFQYDSHTKQSVELLHLHLWFLCYMVFVLMGRLKAGNKEYMYVLEVKL